MKPAHGESETAPITSDLLFVVASARDGPNLHIALFCYAYRQVGLQGVCAQIRGNMGSWQPLPNPCPFCDPQVWSENLMRGKQPPHSKPVQKAKTCHAWKGSKMMNTPPPLWLLVVSRIWGPSTPLGWSRSALHVLPRHALSTQNSCIYRKEQRRKCNIDGSLRATQKRAPGPRWCG